MWRPVTPDGRPPRRSLSGGSRWLPITVARGAQSHGATGPSGSRSRAAARHARRQSRGMASRMRRRSRAGQSRANQSRAAIGHAGRLVGYGGRSRGSRCRGAASRVRQSVPCSGQARPAASRAGWLVGLWADRYPSRPAGPLGQAAGPACAAGYWARLVGVGSWWHWPPCPETRGNRDRHGRQPDVPRLLGTQTLRLHRSPTCQAASPTVAGRGQGGDSNLQVNLPRATSSGALSAGTCHWSPSRSMSASTCPTRPEPTRALTRPEAATHDESGGGSARLTIGWSSRRCSCVRQPGPLGGWHLGRGIGRSLGCGRWARWVSLGCWGCRFGRSGTSS